VRRKVGCGNLPEISRKSPGNQMSSSTSLENYQKLHNYSNTKLKGQIISKCPYEIIVYPKIATKKFPRFLPWPLRIGQIKKIKALYYTNWGLFNIFGIIKFLIQPLFGG